MKQLSQDHPHLWYQLCWVPYLILFFWFDRIIVPKIFVHCALDDIIPFCEWFCIPYCSWFLLLVGVNVWLWLCDTNSYDKLVLMLFSGAFFCLFLYVIFPNGLLLRPADISRNNPAMFIMHLLWGADTPNNVCPSIHCQTSMAMALAFSHSKAAKKPWMRILAWVWAALICISTLFTKQHSVIDVVLGCALVLPWYFILYVHKSKTPMNKAISQ